MAGPIAVDSPDNQPVDSILNDVSQLTEDVRRCTSDLLDFTRGETREEEKEGVQGHGLQNRLMLARESLNNSLGTLHTIHELLHS